MEIRRFQVGDEIALFRVFLSAVHEVASRDYTLEQIQAWAPANIDLNLWANRIQALSTPRELAGSGLEFCCDAHLQQGAKSKT